MGALNDSVPHLARLRVPELDLVAAPAGEDLAVGRERRRPGLPVPIDRLSAVLRLLLSPFHGAAEFSGCQFPVADGGIELPAGAGQRLAVRRKAEADHRVLVSLERPGQVPGLHVPEPDNVVTCGAAGRQRLA